MERQPEPARIETFGQAFVDTSSVIRQHGGHSMRRNCGVNLIQITQN
jgi:hypothetical protein